MNTQSLPALYQIATFGAGFGRQSSHRDRPAADAYAKRPQAAAPAPALQRAPDFLVQLMVSGDPDLRKAIGSRHIAARRESAYAQALAARPSQQRNAQVSIKLA